MEKDDMTSDNMAYLYVEKIEINDLYWIIENRM
jgi:hypothetical protein